MEDLVKARGAGFDLGDEDARDVTDHLTGRGQQLLLARSGAPAIRAGEELLEELATDEDLAGIGTGAAGRVLGATSAIVGSVRGRSRTPRDHGEAAPPGAGSGARELSG